MRKNNFSLLYLILYILILFTGCNDESHEVRPNAQDTTLNQHIFHLMTEWYYWNDHLPKVNPDQFESPQALMEALKYKELDRWSFITDVKSFQQFFEEGKFIGFGFGLKINPAGNLKLSFVYPGSPADDAGLSRGVEIVEINGKSVPTLLNNNTIVNELGEDVEGITTDFRFKYKDGSIENVSLTKTIINMTTVLNKRIIETDGKRIGYMLFTNFVGKAIPELDLAFNFFKNQNISDFILDLRYNSGGGLSVTDHLAGLLRKSAPDNVFLNITYNSKKQDYNNTVYFKNNDAALQLNRIFVITTDATASASEAIINGLRPYIQVITVGEKTSGKPMGMNIFKMDDLAVAPVTFKVNNSLGAADYYDGIEADYYAPDDLDYPLGDENESCLNSILSIIRGETARRKAPEEEEPVKIKQLELIGFRDLIGAF